MSDDYLEKKPRIPLWLARGLTQEPSLVLHSAARLGLDVNKPLLGQDPTALAELRREIAEFCPFDPSPKVRWPHPFEP